MYLKNKNKGMHMDDLNIHFGTLNRLDKTAGCITKATKRIIYTKDIQYNFSVHLNIRLCTLTYIQIIYNFKLHNVHHLI